MSCLSQVFLALLLGLWVLCWSPVAAAHGDFPNGMDVFINEEGNLVGGATSYGLVFLEAEHALWTSDEILDNRLPDWVHRARDGRIMAGTFFGIFETRDGCSWSEQPESSPLFGRYVNKLAWEPDDPDHLFVTTSTGRQLNGVYESFDGGQTWTATGLIDRPLFFQALLVGPDAQDIWVKARAQEDEASGFLFHSPDGGQSWTELQPDLSEYPSTPTFVGMSADGNTLYLATSRRPGLAELLVSHDGVATVETVATFGGGDVINAVVEFKGWRYVIIGEDASFRDRIDGVWERFLGGPTRCLEPHLQPGVLWGCSQFRERFNFMSTTDGENWEYQIRYLEICPRQCPENTLGATVNPEQWPTMEVFGVGDPACHRGQDGASVGDAGPDASDVTISADTPLPSSNDGCECRASSGQSSSSFWWLVMVLGSLFKLCQRTKEGRYG